MSVELILLLMSVVPFVTAGLVMMDPQDLAPDQDTQDDLPDPDPESDPAAEPDQTQATPPRRRDLGRNRRR